MKIEYGNQPEELFRPSQFRSGYAYTAQKNIYVALPHPHKPDEIMVLRMSEKGFETYEIANLPDLESFVYLPNFKFTVTCD